MIENNEGLAAAHFFRAARRANVPRLPAGFGGRRFIGSAQGVCRFLVSFPRVLVSLGGVFHRVPGKLVSGLVIFLFVMLGGDAVGVRGKIVKLGGSLVPVVSAAPSSGGCFSHASLLYRIIVNCNMAIASVLFPCRGAQFDSSLPNLL
jgi:hypothetical protein